MQDVLSLRFSSSSLSLWLYISFLRSAFSQCIGHVCLFVYLSVLEDDNGGNMVVHIVIDNKGETVFHSLTVPGIVVLSLVVLGWVTVIVTGPVTVGSIEDSSEKRDVGVGDCSDAVADYSWNDRGLSRTILDDSNSLLWDKSSSDTLKCNCGGNSVSMQVEVIG